MVQITVNLEKDITETRESFNEVMSQVAHDVQRGYTNGEVSIGTEFVGDWTVTTV